MCEKYVALMFPKISRITIQILFIHEKVLMTKILAFYTYYV